MKTTTRLSFVTFMLLISIYAQGQAVFEFDNIVFATPLPYQKSFFIQGNREFLEGKAIAGTLVVIMDNEPAHSPGWKHEAYKNPPAAKTYYWFNPDPGITKYKFLVTDELRFGVRYKLKFTFYVRTAYSDKLKNRISKETHEALVFMINMTESVNNIAVCSKVNEIVAKIATEEKLKTVIFENGEFREVDVRPSINEIKCDVIAKYAFKEQRIVKLGGDVATDKGKITQFRDQSWEAMKLAMQKLAALVPPKITADEITEAEQLMTTFTAMQPVTENKLATFATTAACPADLKAWLGTAVARSRDLNGHNDLIAKIKLELAGISVDYNTAYDALLDNLFLTLGESSAIVDVKEQPVAANQVDKLRWSVILGGGVTATGQRKLSDTRANAIAYLAYKLYLFSPVDKTVDQPYLKGNNLRNKISLMAGWRIAGDLRYKGTEMGSVLGIKPIAGFGVDLGRNVTLDVFGTFYTQPDKNPFIGDKQIRSSLSVGISIDLDLANRLKALLSGTGYTLPTPTND